MKYKVVSSALWVNGVKYTRGDIIESDEDLGTRVEAYIEFVPKEEKPKRKRRTKAEIDAEREAIALGPDDED